MRVRLPDKPKEWWPKTFPRLWPFVNSTFGIWLLSSVVVGGLGALYTKNQNEQAEALKKIELAEAEAIRTSAQVERLDLEIGYRLSFVVSSMYELHTAIVRCSDPGRQNKLCAATKERLDEMFLARHKPATMFPEFASHSTLALVAELKRLVPQKDKGELEQVIYDMSGLYDRLEVDKVSLGDPKAIAGVVLAKLLRPRWKKGFYYLDCTSVQPFC